MAQEKSVPNDASRSIKLEPRHLECIQLRSSRQETMPSFLAMMELYSNLLYPAMDAFPTNFHNVGSKKMVFDFHGSIVNRLEVITIQMQNTCITIYAYK